MAEKKSVENQPTDEQKKVQEALIQNMVEVAKTGLSIEHVIAKIHIETKIKYDELQKFVKENLELQKLLHSAKLAGEVDVVMKLRALGLHKDNMDALDTLAMDATKPVHVCESS